MSSDSMEGSEAGGPRVNLTVRTRIKKLTSLNRIIRTACDVELSWADFFRKNVKVVVDPKRYKVTALNKSAVFIPDQVRDLIGQFKRIRAVYLVNVVRIRGSPAEKKKTTRVRGRPPKTVAAIPPTWEDQEEGSQIELPRSGSPQTGSSSVRHTPSSSKAAAAPTGDMDRPIRTCPNVANRTAKVLPCPLRYKRLQTLSLPSARPEFPGLGLPTSRTSGPHQSQRRDINVRVNEDDDDDDNASHFSTGSQDSQHDLVKLGIQYEDIKSNIMKKWKLNISNEELLVARHELKKSAGRRSWMRFSRHNPVVCSILTPVFIAS